MNGTYDVVFVIAVAPDGRFRVTKANSGFFEATGLLEAQVVGKLAEDVIPKPWCTLAIGKYRDAIRTEVPARWEAVLDCPTGPRVDEVAIIPVLDANRTCVQLIGLVRDIRARKTAESSRARNILVRQKASPTAAVGISWQTPN